MKFGIVVFPGSNCDDDMLYTLKEVLQQEATKLWHKDTDLQGCDFIILPGGFSYGDYLRSGAVARFSPIMDKVIEHANRGGYVLGICNGFQILTESGLLEGALLQNTNQKYICKNVYLKSVSQDNVLTKNLEGTKTYKIPIAHGEGRYYASADTLEKLEQNHQVLFRYASVSGDTSEAFNPNGSLNNIAGICNAGKNVFGMMPHPERAVDLILGNTDGRAIFESLLQLN